MRKIVRLCLGPGVAIAIVSSATAELAITGAPVAIRAEPTGKAGIVQLIPQSAEIDVEKCACTWCRASWRGRVGHVPAEAVVIRSSPTSLPGDKMPPPVVKGASTDVPPTVFRWTGPYVGVNGGGVSNSWQR